jgi:hypothetical protein
MVIFHSYVKLPEGIIQEILHVEQRLFTLKTTRTVVCCYKGYILSAHSPSSEDSVFIDSFCGQWIIYARYQGATFPFFDR